MPPNASPSSGAPEVPAENTLDSAAFRVEPDGSAPVRFASAPYAPSTRLPSPWPTRRLVTEVQALRAVLKPLPSAPPPHDASS